MQILWLNWKDIRNPQAGGAEVFTHEVARRLINKGHSILLFTSAFPGAKSEDEIDGVRIIRDGTRRSVYARARKFYDGRKADFDLVIDEVNTRPFMTPKFVKVPVIALIHQLAREYWFHETPIPLGLIGYFFLEKWWLKPYVGVPSITVSRSTALDLSDIGFNEVQVVSEGLSYPILKRLPEKESRPTVVYLGRLVRAKRVDHLLASFKGVVSTHPDAQLWIIGEGYERKRLEKRAPINTHFLGRLPNDRVSDLLSRAWILVYPSIREGFGLSIIEANAHGTLSIGYDVPGVRDAIIDGQTGLLVRNGDINELTLAINRVMNEEALRLKLSAKALQYAGTFSWDKTASEFEQVIRTVTSSHEETFKGMPDKL